MKNYFKKERFINYFPVLSAFVFGIYPTCLIAAERCSDMNATYSKVSDSIRQNPPTQSIWLIPLNGPGKINFDKTYNSLISRKIYQTTPRYTCTYNYGGPWITGWGSPTFNKDNKDVPIRDGIACTDNTKGLTFSGDKGNIIDKKGDMVSLRSTVRVRNKYAFCKLNTIETYTLSDAYWEPSGSGGMLRYFPFLLLEIVTRTEVMGNIYTIQSNPQF